MSIGHATEDLNYRLDFSGRMNARAQDGMHQAEENADENWKRVGGDCVFAVARRMHELTVDDVLTELEAVNQQRKRDRLPEFKTHNADALGPLMTRSARAGILRNTLRKVRTKTGHKHGNLRTVWESLVYAGGTQ